MNLITLKHLRYFEALAQHGHFGHAAEASAISQPALSLQIKELEEILGGPLVERAPRHVRLTALGEEVASRARDILRAVDELAETNRATDGPLKGRFRIGMIPTIAPYLLPRTIQVMTQRFPRLDIRPREAVTQKLISDLSEGRLDTAILALPVSEPSLHEEELFDEEFLLVRPSADGDKPVPRPDMLREMRLLLLEEGHCFRDQAISYCKISRSRPRDLMEGSTLATLVQMVGMGIGVTLIPEMSVGIETRSADVSIQRLPEPRPKRAIGMVWRKSDPLGPQLKQLAEVLRGAGLNQPSIQPLDDHDMGHAGP